MNVAELFLQSCRVKKPKWDAAPAKHPGCQGSSGVQWRDFKDDSSSVQSSAEGTALHTFMMDCPISSGSRPVLIVREMWQRDFVRAQHSSGQCEGGKVPQVSAYVQIE